MIPIRQDLTPFTAGDYFPGIPGIIIDIGGVPPAASLVRARLGFVAADKRTATPFVMTTENATITLVSGANWHLSIPRQAVPLLTAGIWIYNLELQDANGVVDTYMVGTQTVFPDAAPTA